MVHPCRSGSDKTGNPRYKMHACALEDSTVTICGLPNVVDVNVLAGYTSVCRTCFPPAREVPWDDDHENPGDAIEGREID